MSAMAVLTFTIESPTSPETVLAALTDFSEQRPALWPELDPDVYRVEQLAATSAVVCEGQKSPRLWALEEYDWATPGTVRWTARASNFCAPGSYMSARVEPSSNGGSRVHVTWSRRGVGPKGKTIVGLMRLTRGKPLAASLSKAIDGLAARVP